MFCNQYFIRNCRFFTYVQQQHLNPTVAAKVKVVEETKEVAARAKEGEETEEVAKKEVKTTSKISVVENATFPEIEVQD